MGIFEKSQKKPFRAQLSSCQNDSFGKHLAVVTSE